MLTMSRAQLLNELVPGLRALFGLEYKRLPQEWSELYETGSSNRAFEEDLKLVGLGVAPVKAEGDTISWDAGGEAWKARYQHETIALGFSITEEAIEDNLYGSLSARYTKELAKAMSYTKEVKGAFPYNTGFTTYVTGDGVSLFNTAHPLSTGQTNSNRPSVAADLNETSLEQACINIAAWTDERGLLIAARPLKLIVPPALMYVAARLLHTDQRVGTADNDINALKKLGSIPQGYTTNHFLTDSNAWFLRTDVTNGMRYFQRVALSTSMDGDFVTGNVRYKARERYSFGCSDPLGLYASPGGT